jgi:hypothetical protein
MDASSGGTLKEVVKASRLPDNASSGADGLGCGWEGSNCNDRELGSSTSSIRTDAFG